MRRIGLVLTVVVVAIASTAMFGAPAGAQPEPMTTVTPRNNVLDGQSVSVAGTDWPASAGLTVQECALIPTFAESCLSPQNLTTDTGGGFTTSYVVQRFFDHGDCATTTDMACYVTVRAADGSFGETSSLQFSISSSQGPDLVVRRRSDGKLIYDNYYTTHPLGVYHPIVAGGSWTYAVLVQNDSGAPADITVHATSIAAPFAVHYLCGFFDVTAAVTGSGLLFRSVAPGESRLIAVGFTADPATPRNTLAQITMTVTTPRVSIPQDSVKLNVITPT